MQLHPAEAVEFHRLPSVVSEFFIQREALQVEVACSRVILLQPDARRQEMKRRRLGRAVSGIACKLATLPR